jgi:pimeloyl-ACP methyl ester carboxylesterase
MASAHANGITIEYEAFGPADGIPLLLIHGFAQQSIAWSAEWIDGFTRAGLKVISYDNRDTGFSAKWDGQIPDYQAIGKALAAGQVPDVPYTLSDMAADAAGLLDAIGIGSAHILGASMGGMIAQLVALEHRSKVRSMINIFSTTGDPDLPRSTREAHVALISEPAGHDRASVIDHVLKSRRAYASKGFPADEERIARHVGQCYDRMYYPEGALRHWAAIVAAKPRGERLRSLSLPTLVLHGTDDTLLPPAHGRRIAECIAGADYHEIAGWGHDIPLGVIPLLHERIVPFIDKVERAA